MIQLQNAGLLALDKNEREWSGSDTNEPKLVTNGPAIEHLVKLNPRVLDRKQSTIAPVVIAG